MLRCVDAPAAESRLDFVKIEVSYGVKKSWGKVFKIS